ncbi:hypothetical protein ACEPAI_7159 [Sanghuangporus weigelae]
MAPALLLSGEGVEQHEQLPSYSDANTKAASPTASSSAAFRTQHSYSLETGKGKPWLNLNVTSRAVSAKVLPVFRDDDEISGEVKINLDKPESYKGVTINILGEFTTVGQESIPFLDLSTNLWSPSPSASKLSGSHTWPFSMGLPKEVHVSTAPKEPGKNYPLPPTFSERASPAYIDYKIIVTVKRGMLKVNQTLSTSFVYVPRWVASPPSPLRITAYLEGSSLLGPEADPEGWKILPPVSVTGILFDSKHVKVKMILALGSPLSYALGSPIPLFLTLKGTDSQALDLLSQPSAQNIFLTRTIAIGSTATDDAAPRRSNNTFPEQVSRAYWWPSEEGAPQDAVRVLQGEIDVPKTLKPEFMFPRLLLRYHVSVFPFSTAGFAPEHSTPKNEPLLAEKISIVTDNAPGVIPRSHAPPGYVKPAEGNYNNSMGYLENGNQRFYGHHIR